MKNKHGLKKVLSLLLVVALMVSMVPAVFAAGDTYTVTIYYEDTTGDFKTYSTGTYAAGDEVTLPTSTDWAAVTDLSADYGSDGGHYNVLTRALSYDATVYEVSGDDVYPQTDSDIYLYYTVHLLDSDGNCTTTGCGYTTAATEDTYTVTIYYEDTTGDFKTYSTGTYAAGDEVTLPTSTDWAAVTDLSADYGSDGGHYNVLTRALSYDATVYEVSGDDVYPQTDSDIYLYYTVHLLDSDGNCTTTGCGYTTAATEDTYAITIDSTISHGTVTTDVSTAAENATVTITVASDIGYELDTLTVTNDSDSSTVTVTSNTFTMPASNVTVSATFKEASTSATEYTVSVSASPAAGGTVSGGGSYEAGTRATVTARPASGYKFVRWTIGGVEVNTNASYSFTVNSDTNLVAVFEVDSSATYSITNATSSSNGTVVLSDSSAVEGETVTITVTPKSGYAVRYVTVTNTTTGDTFIPTKNPDGTYSFTMPASEVTIEVTYRSTSTRPTYYDETLYRITVEDTSNGTVTSSDKKAYAGDTITITIDPDDGYELDELTVTNVSTGKTIKLTDKSTSKVEKYTFTMPSSKVTVEATFSKIAEDEEEVLGTLIKVVPSTPFTDISTSRFKDAIAYVYDAGLMTGITSTTFDPEGTLTRGMIVTVLYRLAGEPDVSGSSIFADVADGLWYTDAIIWATEQGVVNGYGNGNFGPNDPVTREQLAAIFYRYCSANGYYMGNTFPLDGFTDNANVSAYAVTPMEWAVANSVLVSRTTAMLNPTDAATRAEVAQALYILIK